MTIRPRSDMLLEFDGNLDSSGNYVSDWIDTTGIKAVVSRWSVNPYVGSQSFQVDYSIDGVTAPLGLYDGFDAYGFMNIRGRYFRVNISAGSPNAAFRIIIRVSEYL